MNENDVTRLSELFGLSKEIVEASAADGTLSTRIEDSIKNNKLGGYKIYTDDQFSTFKSNHAKEVENNYFNDLVEKSKRGDIPQSLYTNVKGAALEQAEREISKAYKVNDYNGIGDLVDKIVKQSANGNDNEELTRQINDLKQANVKLVEERDKAVQDVEVKYKTMNLERDKAQLLASVPFNFSNVKQEELSTVKQNQTELLQSAFDRKYQLDYSDDGKLVVKQGDDIMKTEHTREPMSPSDVLLSVAKQYNFPLKSPDSGGQGGKSSANSTVLYKDLADFEAKMEAQGIKRNTWQYVDEYRKSGLSDSVKPRNDE